MQKMFCSCDKSTGSCREFDRVVEDCRLRTLRKVTIVDDDNINVDDLEVVDSAANVSDYALGYWKAVYMSKHNLTHEEIATLVTSLSNEECLGILSYYAKDMGHVIFKVILKVNTWKEDLICKACQSYFEKNGEPMSINLKDYPEQQKKILDNLRHTSYKED